MDPAVVVPLIVTPDPLTVTYGDAVPEYTFTLSDGALEVLPADLTTYIAPVCTSDYTDTTAVTDVALPIACLGGSADGYLFTTEATAELTML